MSSEFCLWEIDCGLYWSISHVERGSGEMGYSLFELGSSMICPYCGKTIRIKDE